MAKHSPSRREERVRAFQMLYGLNYVEVASQRSLARAFAESPNPRDLGALGQEPEGFAWDLVLGVWSTLPELNEIISRFSQHWKMERIAKIELTILRLALYEIIHRPDVPLKVAINEAVELAKQFGDDNSRSFVNGILDAAAKAIEHGEIGVR